MNPADLESRPSFALLGPGYAGGACRLLTDLVEGGRGDERLVFAAFETAGRAARVFAAGRAEAVAPAPSPAEKPVPVRLDDAGYLEAVARIREAIAAGDVYQVCHTVRARVPSGTPGSRLFAAMNRGGLAPFAAWVRLPGGSEFVSASPELLLEVSGRRVRTEPMKGTAEAGGAGGLLASAKDRAELAMITDLLRNDLTPICRPRTVRVVDERRVVRLPYALQTVSEIEGTLRPEVGALDALDAVHPGGSVTGAPKRAALAMIRALESTPRGPYCGALGLLSGDRAAFGLLIRTATRDEGGWVYGVGSGVVWDSDPAAELAELRVKLGALSWPTPSSE